MNAKETLVKELEQMEEHDLHRFINEDEARAIGFCDPSFKAPRLDKFITDMILVQECCAKADRFDLALSLNPKLEDLALQMELEDLL